MKHLKKLLVTSAIAFGVTSIAYATESHHGAYFAHGDFFSSLKLTPEQQTKYAEIQRVKRELKEERRKNHQEYMKDRQALLRADVLDLKAFLENEEDFYDDLVDDKNDLHEKTLELWNSLTLDQQREVTKMIKSKKHHGKDRHKGHHTH